MSGQSLLLLIGLNVLIIMTSLQNIAISSDQGLLMLMESKFDKGDQVAKHKDERTILCSLVRDALILPVKLLV